MKKKVVVRVDWREDPRVAEAVESHDEVEEFRISELENGDIEVRESWDEDSPVLLFERKDVPDFAGSMTDEDDHLRDQVERLTEATGEARVLIEGDMKDFETLTHTDVLARSLRGFTASLEENDGAKIKFCSTMDNLVDYAIRTARKNFEESSSSLRVKSAVSKDEDFTMRVYGCVPGIGPSLAKTLYDAYPTLPAALEATVDDLMEIEGVGEVTAERIHDCLHGIIHQ